MSNSQSLQILTLAKSLLLRFFPPFCPHYVCVNFYLCFTFLSLWLWSRTKRTREMRRLWRLTTVVLRLADHLYPFKDTTVSGETANIDDGHRLIFLFIGSLRKVLWWFISVISYRERFFSSLCSVAMRLKDEWFSFEHWQVTCRPQQWRAAMKCKCKGEPVVLFQSTQITSMGIVQK